MSKSNIVFIAKSIDGYIADKNGGLDWLHSISNPEGNDMGYAQFIDDIDAVVMGRATFDTVCSFNISWPYKVPVFVLSQTLKTIKEEYKDKIELMHGSYINIIKKINQKGYNKLYIDGV